MNFWEINPAANERVAVITDAEDYVTYGDLDGRVAALKRVLDQFGQRSLGFMLCDNKLEDLTLYLSCLRHGHVPLLLPADIAQERLDSLVTYYSPTWLAKRGEPVRVPASLRPSEEAVRLHPDLGLLLSTSGSTGSPRLVRLSKNALQANAVAIAQYLDLDAEERAITTLPMNYSYGLSVINSHLLTSGSLILTGASVVAREFWTTVQQHQPTSLAGVPSTYQMLFRTGFLKQDFPSIRTLTQAGGKLDAKLVRAFAEHAENAGRRFFVMYGQTEACARISYVPPEHLLEKLGSIGIPIPGGCLRVSETTGELAYTGPNVMMGYAESKPDLARGDDQHSELLTGDIGRVDSDGFFYITGRLKRFIKVGGNRIGLDEIEQGLQEALGINVTVGGKDDQLIAWLEADDERLISLAKKFVKAQYAIHHTMTRMKLVAQLPLLQTGKKDYHALLDN